MGLRKRTGSDTEEQSTLALRLIELLNDNTALDKLKQVLYPQELSDQIKGLDQQIQTTRIGEGKDNHGHKVIRCYELSSRQLIARSNPVGAALLDVRVQRLHFCDQLMEQQPLILNWLFSNVLNSFVRDYSYHIGLQPIRFNIL